MEQTRQNQAKLAPNSSADAADPVDTSRPGGMLAFVSGAAGAALRRATLVSLGGLFAVAILTALTARYAVAPAHGGGPATALGVSTFTLCAAATIIYAVASSVFRAAADSVRRQRFAQVILERVFNAACRAAPSLAGHDVSRGLSAEDWEAVNDGIRRTRAEMCGGGGIRGRVTGWLFDAVTKRMARSLTPLIGDPARSGEPIPFGSVPAFAARMVNEAVATALDGTATRLLVAWLAVVLLAHGLLGVSAAL